MLAFNNKRKFVSEGNYHEAKRPRNYGFGFAKIKDRVQLADAFTPIIQMGNESNGSMVKWNGGGSVQWNLVKSKLILKFQAENCWHILDDSWRLGLVY
jgi:hypothetical protein